MVFSRITAIILAGLSVQYFIDGLATFGIVSPRLASSSSTSVKLRRNHSHCTIHAHAGTVRYNSAVWKIILPHAPAYSRSAQSRQRRRPSRFRTSSVLRFGIAVPGTADRTFSLHVYTVVKAKD